MSVGGVLRSYRERHWRAPDSLNHGPVRAAWGGAARLIGMVRTCGSEPGLHVSASLHRPTGARLFRAVTLL